MIYTSGVPITRSDLRRIPLPPAGGRKKWQGVQHGMLADTIVDYVEHLGIPIIRETWYVNPQKNMLFGGVDLATDGTILEFDAPIRGNFSLGVRHDNKGRYAVSFAVGARVRVCSNGVFTGDFVLKCKHTEELNLKDLVADGVESYLAELAQVGKFIRSMYEIPMTDRDAMYMIMQAAENLRGNDNGCLNWVHLEKVVGQWRNPDYEEFKVRNLWSVYNSFTTVAKQLTPPRQIRLLKGLREIVEDYKEEIGIERTFSKLEIPKLEPEEEIIMDEELMEALS